MVDYIEGMGSKYIGYLFDPTNPEKKAKWFAEFWDVLLPVVEARFVHGKPFIGGT